MSDATSRITARSLVTPADLDTLRTTLVELPPPEGADRPRSLSVLRRHLRRLAPGDASGRVGRRPG